ncbi:MAG: hypothetical protein AAFV53_30205 [Myxococcota bacterium]
MRNALPLLSLLALAGCNQYEFFNLAGYEQASFSNDAEVIFVVDNSNSMTDEAGALALNIDTFVAQLADESGALGTETLSDAVGNYLEGALDRSNVIDYQLALTTASVQLSENSTAGLDPGEAGTLVGDPTIISKFDANIESRFRQNLICNIVPWNEGELPSELSYECGTPSDEITREFLDCECGFGEWQNDGGHPEEEMLESALLTLCRSVDTPPDLCFEFEPYQVWSGEDPDFVPDTEVDPNRDGLIETGLSSADINSNNNDRRSLVRDNSTVVFVLIGDEGDTSKRRLPDGEEDATRYVEAFEAFNQRVRIVGIGPNYDDDTNNITCNSGSAPTWAAERLLIAAEATGGFYAPLAEQVNGECQDADFAAVLTDLGDLLNELLTAFPLQSIPDVESIRVFVDGEEMEQAAETDLLDPEAAEPEYRRGWSYDSSQNAVQFWGDSIPDFSQEVDIFYRPLEGKPRELPF